MAAARSLRDVQETEVSVVIPCLNEADTVAICIRKAVAAMERDRIAGEVIVADNGSTDGSVEIARREGARVVPVTTRGYGAALMGGIDAAAGRFIVMGDADDSYDFSDIPRFVERLRQGFDLVQGCRLESGGGRVLPGAMPFLHRWLGNPMFSALARRWFRAPVNDIYCGLRGFTRDLVPRLDQRCTGMEFATEMVIKASLIKARVCEVPITLHPDGRRAHAPVPAPVLPAPAVSHTRSHPDGDRAGRILVGAAKNDRGTDRIRRPHAALRQPRGHQRLSERVLRHLCENLRHPRRTASRGYAPRAISPGRHPGARRGDRCGRGGARPRVAPGSRAAVADAPLRIARLCADDAPRRAW